MISALNEEDNHIATACVGHCDVSYSMDCPRGKRVAPRDLTYHAKKTSTQCPTFKQNPDMMCQSSENCCGYNGGDCGQPFSYSKAFGVFNNCSGYQNCGWFRAESVDFGAHCSYRNYSNYISASFSCIRGNLNSKKILSTYINWHYVQNITQSCEQSIFFIVCLLSLFFLVFLVSLIFFHFSKSSLLK